MTPNERRARLDADIADVERLIDRMKRSRNTRHRTTRELEQDRKSTQAAAVVALRTIANGWI